ncbi:hypothetical protein S83_003655 [Arachis hypogaea]
MELFAELAHVITSNICTTIPKNLHIIQLDPKRITIYIKAPKKGETSKQPQIPKSPLNSLLCSLHHFFLLSLLRSEFPFIRPLFTRRATFSAAKLLCCLLLLCHLLCYVTISEEEKGRELVELVVFN